MKLNCRILASMVLGVLALGQSAHSQTYPNRALRIVVPSTPGGGLDTAARLIATKMASNLGQAVVVENRPGAGGHIAQEAVAKAAPDGYTILLDAPNLAIGASLYRNLPFDPAKDFIPVTQLATTPLVVVASPKSQIASIADLVARAKARPGRLNYGHMGVGTTLHLTMEWLKMSVGADIQGIAYKGDALIGVALMSGEVDLAILPLPSNLAAIKAGRLHAVAVTGPKRSAQLPDVPTVKEAGGGFEFVGWQGLFVPAKTPRAIVDTLYREAVKALNSPDVREQILAMGQEGVGSSPTEFAATYNENLAQFGRIVKEARISLQD